MIKFGASLLTVLTLASTALTSPAAARVREVASFPVGAWLENLAVRACGELLVTRVEVAEVWSVSPVSGRKNLVARFPDTTSATGITEIEHDLFAVNTGNYSAQSGFTPGSYAVWTVDLRGKVPKIRKIAAVPSAGMLNGLVALPGARVVLAADSVNGAVYKIDLRSGNATIALAGDAFAAPPPPAYPLGVNGVHLKASSLYFTNTGAGTYSRIAIHPDGTAAGPVETLRDDLELPDDFALSPNGLAYTTVNQIRSIVAIDTKGARVQIAGGANSIQFATPTAAQFGRTVSDRTTVYVTTGGVRDEAGTAVTSGKVLALTLH